MARGGRQQWVSLGLCVLLGALLGTAVNAQQEEEVEGEVGDMAEVLFYPERLHLVTEGTTVTVAWYTNASGSIGTVWPLMEKWREAEVAGYGEVLSGAPDIDANETEIDLATVTFHGFINVTAKFVGYNTLLVELYDEQNETAATGVLDMTIKLKSSQATTIFTYISAVLTAIAYFLMGMTIDLKIVKGIAKKPVGPVVGIFCQYILMPLIAFALGLVLFPGDSFDDRLMRLGLFLGGCCPGGGASNMWTHLLGGSLDLSITMTGVSTFVAFGSVPVWVLTMGPVIINDASFVIPFTDITITVIMLIVPCGVGIALQARYPGSKLQKICAKVMSPTFAFNLTITFTFGVYAYLYVFSLFTWRMLVAGLALPTLGYLAGMGLALLLRMDTPRVIAIGVETGVQNYNIALIILMLTLKPPAGQIATALPAAFTMFTPLPLLMLFVVRRTYLRLRGRSPTAPTSTSTDLKDLATKDNASKDTAQQHNGTEKKGVDNLAADLTDKV